MGISERKIRQKESVRTSILQAAWQVVLQEGWQALSIRKIADAIEYSVPVVYSHFENKDAILLEFTRQGFRMLAQSLQQARDLHKNPGKQLETMAKAYWHFASTQKEYYQLMFGLGIPACERVNQVAEMQTLTCVMISSIQAAIAAGNNKEADCFLKFHTYWSILHGLVSIHMLAPSATPEANRQMILQDAVAGFIGSLER